MLELKTNHSEQIGKAVKDAAAAGLVVRSYCVGIQQQPAFLLPKDLQTQMPDVNKYLKNAQGHAGKYLNEVEPRIVGVITDVSGFSATFPALARQINVYLDAWNNSGSETDKKRALETIGALKNVVQGKVASSQGVSTSLGEMVTFVNDDVGNFNKVSQACSVLITGDKGELQELKKQLSGIDGKIAGASIGVALSGLAIAGGVFMIVVGAVADFFTAGTSTPLVVAGAILTGAGAAGLIASSVTLSKLVEEKGNLLKRQATLKNYVSALEGCKSSVDLLYSGAQNAASSLVAMKGAWEFLYNDLGQVEASLRTAQSCSDMPPLVRTFFNVAEGQWTSVISDIEAIKKQMLGVEIKKLTNGKLTVLRTGGLSPNHDLGEITEGAVLKLIS